jgi:hypothetical protein
MNLVEAYLIYKEKGLVPRGTSTMMQKFFKTNPTTEQLIYLQDMNRTSSTVYTLIAIIYLLLGTALGMAIGLTFCKLGAVL